MRHNIDTTEFAARLNLAAETVVGFTRPMVKQALGESYLFFIEPSSSFDGNPLVDDEEIFPQDTLTANQWYGSWDALQVSKWLVRDGKIPEWIDIRAYDADKHHTVFLLETCGRFTALADRLYHKEKGIAPFALKSPVIPPGWIDVETNGRFDLEAKRSI